MHLPKNLRIAFGAAVSLLCLAAACYQVRPAELCHSLRGINLPALLVCLAFFLLSCLMRALIWRITAARHESSGRRTLGLSNLFGGVMVGYMANNLLPLRAGELVRAYYLSRRTGTPYTEAFATVCIERALDLCALLLLLAAGLLLPARGPAPEGIKFGLGVLVCALSVGAVLLFAAASVKDRLRSSRLSLSLQKRVTEFTAPLLRLGRPKTVALLVLLALAVWAASYVSLLALLWGTPAWEPPEQAGNRLGAALLLLLFVNLGLLLPSSPGALGVMQVAFLAALTPFGILKADALALSFAYHGGLYLLTLTLGTAYALPAGFSIFRAGQPTRSEGKTALCQQLPSAIKIHRAGAQEIPPRDRKN